MKIRIISCLLAIMFLFGCNSGTKKEKKISKIEISILAAASLTEVCTEIEGMYEANNSDIDILFSFGGSGALQTQIEEGAPADAFFSAARKQMNALISEDLINGNTVIDLLENRIVLIVPEENPFGINSFEDVNSDEISLIALGEPSSVPIGQYSEEIFEYLGILDNVKTKTSYASDVKQVLSWVETRNVDCGVVYSTDANLGRNITIVCKAPENSHSKVVYPIGMVKSTDHPKEVMAFMSFLETEECSEVFERYGFTALKR